MRCRLIQVKACVCSILPEERSGLIVGLKGAWASGCGIPPSSDSESDMMREVLSGVQMLEPIIETGGGAPPIGIIGLL